MSRLPSQTVLAALVAAAFAAGPAGAGDATAESATVQTATSLADTVFVAATAEQAAAAAVVDATPLGQEVAAIRAAFSARLAELTAGYRAAADADAAAEAQRAITAHKLGLELDLLGLQLRLARERNDAEAIAELETSRTTLRAHLAADTGLDIPEATNAGADSRGERRP